MVDAVPHDLLKVLDWRRHADRGFAEERLTKNIVEWYRTEQLDKEGKMVERKLIDVIRGHQPRSARKARFWMKMLAYADKLSTVAGRFRLSYDYWHAQNIDPFFVRVYGDIKEWNEEERNRVWNRIVEILNETMKRGGHPSEAYKEVNELLSEFPADSRFPYASLKTHHWLTDAIRCNRLYWERIKATPRGETPSFENLYLIRLSIPTTEFHKVKELRAISELKERFFDHVSKTLSRWSPLRIGDDIYMLCITRSEVKEILSALMETRLGEASDIDIFIWFLERRRGLFKAVKEGEKIIYKPETIYTIKKIDCRHLSMAYEDLDYVPESYAEYASILEGEFDYVAWVAVRPRGDMRELSEEFLEWGEGELERRYGDRRVELPETVREPEEFLSPDLALSIAEGYGRFLDDCESVVKGRGGCAVVKSFRRAFFVCGLDAEEDGFKLYWELSPLKGKLHIPASLSVIVSRPKYPFWRVVELSLNFDGLIFIVGEKVLRLSDEDVTMLWEVAPKLRCTTRRQFGEIIKRAGRIELGELKIFIKGRREDGKICPEAAEKLIWMIEKFEERYRERDKLMAVLKRAFKLLEPFTRSEERRRGRRRRYERGRV